MRVSGTARSLPSGRSSASSPRVPAPTAPSSPTSARACSGAFFKLLHARTERIGGDVDRLPPELHDLQREQDRTEIRSRELESVTGRPQNPDDRRDNFQKMFDAAATPAAKKPATPGIRDTAPQTGRLTSAAIDEQLNLLPKDVIAFSGGITGNLIDKA